MKLHHDKEWTYLIITYWDIITIILRTLVLNIYCIKWFKLILYNLLTISHSPSHTHHITLIISHSPYHAHHLMLTTSCSPHHAHHIMLTISRSPSYAHHHIIAISISPSYLHHITLTISRLPSHAHHLTLTVSCSPYHAHLLTPDQPTHTKPTPVWITGSDRESLDFHFPLLLSVCLLCFCCCCFLMTSCICVNDHIVATCCLQLMLFSFFNCWNVFPNDR